MGVFGGHDMSSVYLKQDQAVVPLPNCSNRV
jgi:hypothetical protein